MRTRAAFAAVILVLTALPGLTYAASGGKTATDTVYGITQYQWLDYNSQSCAGSTHYQLYLWESRYYRIDTTRKVQARGLAVYEGRDCSNITKHGSVGQSLWYYPCFHCRNSASDLWSGTYSWSITAPYVDAGEALEVGSWLEGRMMTSGGTLKGSVCQTIVIQVSMNCLP